MKDIDPSAGRDVLAGNGLIVIPAYDQSLGIQYLQIIYNALVLYKSPAHPLERISLSGIREENSVMADTGSRQKRLGIFRKLFRVTLVDWFCVRSAGSQGRVMHFRYEDKNSRWDQSWNQRMHFIHYW